MGILKKLQKSKTFIALLIACVLVFSYEVNKPKAFAPIPFLVAIGVGMAAETLITMGVKAGSRSVLKKQALSYSDDLARTGKFDWADTNPYRNKDGSITLSPTANDRAKLAGLIGGSMAGMYAESLLNPDESSCIPPVPTTGVLLPMILLPGMEEYHNYYNRYLTFYYVEDENGHPTAYAKSKVTGRVIKEYRPSTNVYTFKYMNVRSADNIGLMAVTNTGSNTYIWSTGYTEMNIGSNYFTSQQTASSVSSDIGLCNELLIPSTVQRVYPAPMDMTSTYQMPNNDQLANIPFVINNVFPASEDEGEITWAELEEYFDRNGFSIDDVMDTNIDKYLEKGDINYNPITIEEINNHYTDVEQDEKIEDFNPPTGELPVPVPDGGELIPVEPIDRSLLQIAKESYQYLADTVKTSVEGLTAITAGATGLITFLGTTMGWLPDEWIVMFSAAFGLGLFAFFFRR